MRAKLRKKNNKRGFTLIEVIVVLVIIAVLLAALLPSFIGFINTANRRALSAEARGAYIAAQAAVTEGRVVAGDYTGATLNTASTVFTTYMQGVPGGLTAVTALTVDANGVVNSLTYTRGTETITITPGTGMT